MSDDPDQPAPDPTELHELPTPDEITQLDDWMTKGADPDDAERR